MKHSVLTPSLPLLLVACLLLMACQSGPPEGVATSDGFPAPDREFVWNAAVRALGERGMVPDYAASSKESGCLVTHWKMSLQPFSGQGHRDQATVTIREVPGRCNFFATDTQVVRQVNNNMTDPGNPICAKWECSERVPEVECVINQSIEMTFLGGNVSPEFRERYSMPQDDGLRIPSYEVQPPPPSPEERGNAVYRGGCAESGVR